MPYTRLEFLFYTIDGHGKRFSAHPIHKHFFFSGRGRKPRWDGALSCPLLPYSSIDLTSPPNDTRVSETDACLLVLFFCNNVLLSRTWCGQLVDYVEDIRYTVQMVHITTIVLEHDVAEAHARHVQKVFRSILYLFALAHASLSGLRGQYQMFGTRRRTIKSKVFTSTFASTTQIVRLGEKDKHGT
ncbi:hypothetical protein EDB83DRAFT_1979854 [Lactarius deliciosus]|nr:hypothetical protein EDB83DRAFT_1979854 [Lactarius deliciosus]